MFTKCSVFKVETSSYFSGNLHLSEFQMLVLKVSIVKQIEVLGLQVIKQLESQLIDGSILAHDVKQLKNAGFDALAHIL